MSEQFLGTTDALGNPIYPDKTISGNDWDHRLPPGNLFHVQGGFVVLDMYPPAGFDLDAALTAAGLSRPTPPTPPKPSKGKAADAAEPTPAV